MAAMTVIHGIPYAPGRARGRVVRDPARAGAGDVLAISQAQLAAPCRRPAAFVVAAGAPFSHPMIRLLALEIPVVIVPPASLVALTAGSEIVVDGYGGVVADTDEILVPVPGMPPVPKPGTPILSADGQEIVLRASVANAKGAALALRRGAAAIGMVRTEFLGAAGDERPDAGFYEAVLREVCEAAGSLAVTVRLIDIAADKRPAWLTPVPGMEGVLGLQGIRLYEVAEVREALAGELDAVSRLAPEFDLSLLLPDVTQIEEFRHWRTEIERVLPVPPAIGSMIETPAAALAVTDYLAAADFVALGCNDLMQCLFAADRDIPQVAALLDPYAPLLYRFLGQIATDAGGQRGRIQVCGLLAQLPGILPILLGLGYRTFSIEPAMIPYLARTAAATDTAAASALAVAVCAATTSAAVRGLAAAPARAIQPAHIQVNGAGVT
ncbi:MAG: phosphoenolpyruvate-protein phosphotransferase [Gammaproteobacteria bacterium]